MACDQAAQARSNNKCFQHKGASFVAQCLIEQLKDRDAGGGKPDFRKITYDGEEHGHGEKPACDKADADGAHDGDRHHFLWAMDLLCEMGCAVETRKAPVCVYKPDDEGNAAFFPACVVDEGCEDELGLLVRWGDRGDGDEDYGE